MKKYCKLIIKSIEKITDLEGIPKYKYWACIEMPSARLIKVKLTKRDYELINK